MTAPQEPLKLTLEEALCLLYNTDAGWLLVAVPARGRATAHSWELHDADDEWRSEHATWHEAVGVALGRKVVPRDDAAELRAALREWAEATRAAEWFELDQTNAYGDDHIDAEDRLQAAVKALRALAATEGKS